MPENYVDHGNYEGDTEQIDTARKHKPICGMKGHQPQYVSDVNDKGCEETLPRSEEHVRIHRDVKNHEIGTHDANQHRQGRSEQFGFEIDKKYEYPWVAPMMVSQYVNLDMGNEKPKSLTIDNYDGEESWA